MTRAACLTLQLALAGLCTWGCAEDLCKSHTPAFQVDLTLGPGVDANRVHKLTADLSAAKLRKVTTLDVSRIRATGKASFDVTVGPAGDQGFEAVVRVEATDTSGGVVARAGLSFKGSPDACNLIALTLSPPPGSDGGPPDDVGPDLGPGKDGPIRPQDDLCPEDLPLPDANTYCFKDGASCMGGKGTCYKGKCCTGCWTNGPLVISCQPGTTPQHCGLGGSICVQCIALHKCLMGLCVPAWP